MPVPRGYSLFSEDFDTPAAPVDAPPAPEPPPEPDPCAAAVADAQAAAFAEGLQAGLARAAAERAADGQGLLAALAAGLAEAAARRQAQCEALAEEIARLLFAGLHAAFPALTARHGPAEAAGLARSLLPTLTEEALVTIRIGPQAHALLEAEVAALDPETRAHLRLLPCAEMAAGDLRMNWRDGQALRDGAGLWARVRAVLAGQGLLDADETEGAADV